MISHLTCSRSPTLDVGSSLLVGIYSVSFRLVYDYNDSPVNPCKSFFNLTSSGHSAPSFFSPIQFPVSMRIVFNVL